MFLWDPLHEGMKIQCQGSWYGSFSPYGLEGSSQKAISPLQRTLSPDCEMLNSHPSVKQSS